MLEDTTWGCGSLAERMLAWHARGSWVQLGGGYRPLIPALGRQGRRILELAWFTKQVLEQPGLLHRKTLF